MNTMYKVSYKAVGEFAGEFSSADLDETGKDALIKSLLSDSNIVIIMVKNLVNGQYSRVL